MNFIKIKKKLDDEKRIIETLPENTIINRNKKRSYILNVLEEFKEIESSFISELSKRYSKFVGIKENKAISILKEEEHKLSVFRKWNKYNTAYEKMHLDYYFYHLHQYNNTDFEGINECLSSILESFKNVGINLTHNSFYFHMLAKDYVKALLMKSEERDDDVFETIYNECPEIISIIEVNLKSIYYRNYKKAEKYYEEVKKEYLSNHNEDEIYNTFQSTVVKRKELENEDKYTIIESILNNEFSLDDISEESLNKSKNILFKGEVENITNTVKVIDSFLMEYEFYMKYNYIITDIARRAESKGKPGKEFDSLLKKIRVNEDKLEELIDKKDEAMESKLFSNKVVKLNTSINNLLHTIKKLYEKLEDIRYNILINNNLRTDMFINEALMIASSNYTYFAKITLEKCERKDMKNITKNHQELWEFTYGFPFKMLNNIGVLKDKNFALNIIMCNMLREYNVFLEPSDLECESFNKIKKCVDNLLFSYYFDKTSLNKEEVAFYLSIKNANLFK